MDHSNTDDQFVLPRRDEQTMFSLIEEQKQSGLTVKTFCEEKQIPSHSFYYWNKKYRDKNSLEKRHKASFAMLNLQDDTAGKLFCELITPGGGRLKFYQPVPATLATEGLVQHTVLCKSGLTAKIKVFGFVSRKNHLFFAEKD